MAMNLFQPSWGGGGGEFNSSNKGLLSEEHLGGSV